MSFFSPVPGSKASGSPGQLVPLQLGLFASPMALDQVGLRDGRLSLEKAGLGLQLLEEATNSQASSQEEALEVFSKAGLAKGAPIRGAWFGCIGCLCSSLAGPIGEALPRIQVPSHPQPPAPSSWTPLRPGRRRAWRTSRRWRCGSAGALQVCVQVAACTKGCAIPQQSPAH